MEMNMKVIIILVIAALIITAVSSFFLLQSGQQISKADATRIFNQQCQAYASKNCAWSVTYSQDFSSFVSACKVLYGQDKEAFACLYSLCGACKSFNLEQIQCSEMCSRISGLQKAGTGDISGACSDYKAMTQCTQISCSVCA